MFVAIPVLGDRVSPRCSIADKMMILNVSGSEIVSEKEKPLSDGSWGGIMQLLVQSKARKLVCGGINRFDKDNAVSKGIIVIDNVACGVNEVFEAIRNGKLKPGLGFSSAANGLADKVKEIGIKVNPNFNCLSCPDKDCEDGRECPMVYGNLNNYLSEVYSNILETAADISLEEERQLCRLSEVIYFALEMKYKKIGLAYCTELTEQCEILTALLGRFFDVYPVSCKAGGKTVNQSSRRGSQKILCNPEGQAKILNEIETDLNILVGLCVGADCIFNKESAAPATTLFVKDKSLANNPIGALYSQYYINEATNNVII